jgi:SAM-dependent methyltransferase
MIKQKGYYWEDNTVTLEWADFKDDKHGDINELTNTVVYLAQYLDKDIKILELGAGQGRNIQALRQLGYDATGIEINKDNIAQAKKDYGIEIKKGEAIATLKKLKDIDCILTCSAGYLMDKEVFELINKKAKYYIAVEPTEDTYFTPGSDLYHRYDIPALLPNMRRWVKTPCLWDSYTGYLFERGV